MEEMEELRVLESTQRSQKEEFLFGKPNICSRPLGDLFDEILPFRAQSSASRSGQQRTVRSWCGQVMIDDSFLPTPRNDKDEIIWMIVVVRIIWWGWQ